MLTPPIALTFASALRGSLLRWFARNRRPLPWRETSDPYRVWISEVMLQQTRVAAVLEHYAEFLRRFPDVRSLAAAGLPDVLAAWSGLGYYRRARSLHQAARIVVRDHDGRLPENAAALQMLPGIGRYTAAAIASIAFREPRAVVDGNVERVLRRLLAWPRHPLSRIWDAAEQLLSQRSPGNYNQAIMELGALICLPGRPRCEFCPVSELCATARGQSPLPSPAHGRPVRKSAQTTYALATRDARVYLIRRGPRESLMPGMWELPQLPLVARAPSPAEVTGHRPSTIDSAGAPHLPGFGRCGSVTREFTLRHSITVTDYTVHVCRVSTPGVRGGRWFRLPDAAALPLTGLARRILRRAALI